MMECASQGFESLLFNQKEDTLQGILFLAKQNNIDTTVPKARSRKRFVVKQRRYECVYKRIADLNVTFLRKRSSNEAYKK